MTALLPDDLDDRVVTPHRPELRNAPQVVGIGLDSRSAMARHLHRESGERLESARRAKMARGEPGRETGQGFFSWEAS